MATREFKRKSIKFINKGVRINRPVDLLGEGYYQTLTNVRSYLDGTIQQRMGFQTLVTPLGGSTPVHSIRLLNDDVPGASQVRTAICGVGTSLYSTNANISTLTSRDTGYSGKYLSLISHRPDQSPEPWMYVGDSSKMRKINVGGDDYPIGISPPNVAPIAIMGVPTRKVISDFDTAADWTESGDAGVPAVVADNRVSTTIAAILYYTGSTGWALVKPTSMTDGIQPGARLSFQVGPEIAVVEEVFSSISSSSIGSITYDSGTSGLCTIQLAAPAPTGIKPNMMLNNSTASEYIRVLNVTTGPDGSVSFRTSTSATFATTNAIAGVDSFRVYFTGTQTATSTIKGTFTSSAFTFSTGTGAITDTNALDLTISASNGRPIQDDDEIHISVRISDLTAFTEGRIMFDVDASTNDFTQNYYYFPFRANDLTQALAGTSTSLTAEQLANIRQGIIARQQIERNRANRVFDRDAPILNAEGEVGPGFPRTNVTLPPGQTITGANQWTELKCKVKDLIRVGADSSRTLKNVAALRVSVLCTANFTLDLDSWWIGGTYGPDAVDNPINYRFRARASVTGAVSNPSPPMRSTIEPHREQVVLTLPQHTDTQVDKLDIFRVGGTLLDWTYVGTVNNPGGTTTTFTDNYLDAEIASNPLLEFDNFQPFPVLDIPRTGTCSVSGTKVTRSAGDTFNVSWAPGSVIFINGIAYTLYTSPTSTSVLEISENAGTQTSVSFSLPAATILGQPLPILIGPYGGGETGIFMFGLGATQQPGTLFWTKGNNPDAAPERNQLEITSPSEQLMTGCIYDGRPYIFTTERMYMISRNFDGPTDFVAQEVANSKGAFARWGVTVGDLIYFIARDGIYQSEGGQPRSITDETLSNLFAHDAGVNTVVSVDLHGLIRPDFSNADGMRLTYFNSYLYFTYADLSGGFHTLIYDTKSSSWSEDTSSKNIISFYPQEGKSNLTLLCGSDNGGIYNYGGSVTDTAVAFTSKILTGYEDMGDSRGQKLFRDIVLDADCAGGTLTVKVYKNSNNGTILQTYSVASGSGRASTILDLNNGEGYLAKNLAIEISWNSAAARLFEWHPSYLDKAEKIESRFTDWTDAGVAGDKRVMGFLLDADTYNASKSIQLQYDGGSSAQTYNITHDGQRRISYAVTTPVVAKLVRIAAQDEIPWYLEQVEWIVEPYAESLQLTPDFQDDGDIRAKWLQGFDLEADTGGVPISIQLQGDGGTVIQTFTANHNNRIVIPYSLTNAYITHTMRLVPSGPIRVFNVKWFWRPESESVLVWEAPPTTLGLTGYWYLRDGFIAHRSTADLTLTITVDGTAHIFTIAHSNGNYKKSYVPLTTLKGKQMQFKLTSTSNFRFYRDDSEFRVKAWGSGESFQIAHPFGTPQNTGAEI